MEQVNLLHNNYNRIGPTDYVTFQNKQCTLSLVSKFHSIVVKEITSHNVGEGGGGA